MNSKYARTHSSECEDLMSMERWRGQGHASAAPNPEMLCVKERTFFQGFRVVFRFQVLLLKEQGEHNMTVKLRQNLCNRGRLPRHSSLPGYG